MTFEVEIGVALKAVATRDYGKRIALSLSMRRESFEPLVVTVDAHDADDAIERVRGAWRRLLEDELAGEIQRDHGPGSY